MNIAKALMLLTAATSAFAQQPQGFLMGGTVGQSNGISFRYETRLEPPFPTFEGQLGGGVMVISSTTHRFFYDGSQKKYLGYDVASEAVQNGVYRLTFLPLSIGPDKLRLKDPTSWTFIPLPQYPVQRTVRVGDRVALELLVKPDSHQRIVDYLTIDDRFAPPAGAVSGLAKDFSLHDVELHLSSPQLTINGQSGENDTGVGVTGAVAWFYVRDRGRFLLSLMPYESLGFRRAGETRGRTASFEWLGDKYLLTCREPVAPGPGAYNLYVLADPSYRPKTGDGGFLLGAADRPEHVTRGR